MLFRLLLLLLGLVGSAQALEFDAQARAYLAKQPVVKIGVIADNVPYSMVRGGRAAGFSIAILDDIARLSGLRFDYKVGSWPEIYRAFERGEIDAIDEISWRAERTAFTLFTEPYHHRRTVIMHDVNRPLPPISKLEDLKPFRVGLVSNIFYKSSFSQRGLDVVEYDGLPNLVRALAFGWIDAIVGPEVTLAYLAKGDGLNHLTVAARVPMDGFELEDFRIGVRKEKPELFRIIDASLAAIQPERRGALLAVWQDFGGKAADMESAFRLSASDAEYLQRIGPVRVGLMRDYAPFSFVDGGRPQGLAVDVLARIQDLTGLQVVPVADRWPVLFEMLQKGEIDLLANISYSPDRLSLARFTDAYHLIPNVVFTRNAQMHITQLDDLAGRRIALGDGIFYEASLRQRFGDAVISYGSQEAMFQALSDGVVDVALASIQNGNHWVRELQLADVRIAGELRLPEFAGEDLRFGVRPALEPLAGIMSRALAAISPTERRVIENRWLGAQTSKPRLQVALNEHERAFLAAHGKLVVCVDPDWMPLEALNARGEHVGMAADFLAHMTGALDLAVEVLRTRSWQESIEAAQARRCDMLSMAMRTPQRSLFLDFTAPYYSTPNVLLARIESPFVDGIDAFSGRKVGIVRGHAFAELLRARHPRLELIEVDNERSGLVSLQRGQLDGYIGAMATVNHYLRELGFADIKVIGRAPGDWALSLATRNDKPELQTIARKMIDSLGEVDRRAIESRWHSVRIEQKLDLRQLWQWGAIVVLALGFLIFWNRKLGALNRQLGEANRQLAQLTLTDPLTQIGNRKYFDQEYLRDFRWCQRRQCVFAVAMIDIDHFKQVNDRFGHAAGDDCLRALAQCLRDHLRRETDRLARFGGEEFVAFMPLEGNQPFLERFEALRRAVGELRISAGGAAISFTVSIGVAHGIPAPDALPDEWLKRADEALYAAKGNGRNCIEMIAL